MGKYDKFYENYYKKLDVEEENKNFDFHYEDAQFRNDKYGRRQNNSMGGIVLMFAIPILVLGGFGIYKFSKTDQGQKVYNDFLEAISSVETIVSGEEKEDTIEEQKAQINDAIDEGVKPANTAPTSFVLDDDNVEMVDSDKKYSDFVSALNGIKVKAKSEEGIVLTCKYKIIATSLSGVIDAIGENAEGYFVTIDHGNDIKTSYYNLPELNYVKGQAIKKGEKITEIKEEREIVFKIKENDEFITPRMYLDFIE
ncbi:MAG: M23 family metallopeptidase [Sarcina sp.]